MALKNFSATDQGTPSSYFHSFKRHAVFHSFMKNTTNHDAATTATHGKQIIEVLKNRQLFFWYE